MERKENSTWGVISSLQKIEIYYENDLGKDNDNLKAYIWEIEKSIQHNKKVDLSQAIEKTKEEITFAEIDLETYEVVYEETLKEKREIVKENIQNLNIENRKFWIGLLIGAVLGGIISYLINLLPM